VLRAQTTCSPAHDAGRTPPAPTSSSSTLLNPSVSRRITPSNLFTTGNSLRLHKGPISSIMFIYRVYVPARHNAKPENRYCLRLSFPACTRRVNGTHTDPMCRNRQPNTERLPAGPACAHALYCTCIIVCVVWASRTLAEESFFSVSRVDLLKGAHALVGLLFLSIYHACATVVFSEHASCCRVKRGRAWTWTWRKKSIFVFSNMPADPVEFVGDYCQCQWLRVVDWQPR